MKTEKIYRKIWIDCFGPIPIDKDGRSYEIHHINGDHFDNRIENLQCISIDEHLKIHLDQGDYLAAAAIARRMCLENADVLGKLGGQYAYENKLGIHGLSYEENLENCRKGGKATVGLVWWNNGSEQTRSKNPPSEGWIRGRVGSYGYPTGRKLGAFWNNGKLNIRSVSQPGPEWERGRLLSEEQKLRRSNISKSIVRTEESKRKTSESMKKHHSNKIKEN